MFPKSVNNPRGIAIDPSTNHFHVLSPNQKRLYELDEKGNLVATRNLSGLDLTDPQALVFAPSGDSTDPANRTSLYVADSNATSGGIVELSFLPYPHAAQISVHETVGSVRSNRNHTGLYYPCPIHPHRQSEPMKWWTIRLQKPAF